MADTLASIAVVFFADTTALRQGMDRAVSDAVAVGGRGGRRSGEAFGDALNSAISSRLGNTTSLVQRLLEGSGVGAGASLRVGLGAAIAGGLYQAGRFASNAGSEVAGYRRQLQRLAGDAGQGEMALRRIQRAANDTDFDTGQVFSLATTLSGRYGDVDRGSREALTVLDATADLGVSGSDFGRFQVNLAQILAKQKGKLDVDEVRQLRLYAPSIAQRIAKSGGGSLEDANKLLDSGTGQQLYDAILRIGEANKGAAAAAAAKDPQRALLGLTDSAKNAMAPTSEQLNTVLTPTIGLVKRLTDTFGDLNNATGGGAGMIAGAGALTVAVKLTVPPLQAAYRGVGDFRNSLISLIATLEGAAIASRAAALAEGQEAMATDRKTLASRVAATTPGAVPVVSPLVQQVGTGAGAAVAAGTAGAVAAAKAAKSGGALSAPPGTSVSHWWERPTAAPKGSLAFPSLPQTYSLKERLTAPPGVSMIAKGVGLSILPMIAAYGADALARQGVASENPIMTHLGRDLSAMITWGSAAAIVGGTIAGPLGAIAGGLGAATIALGASEFQQYQEGAQAATAGGGGTDKNTKALERNTSAVEKMSVKMTGGGDRARQSRSILEHEYAALSLLRLSTTGVG